MNERISKSLEWEIDHYIETVYPGEDLTPEQRHEVVLAICAGLVLQSTKPHLVSQVVSVVAKSDRSCRRQ